jgi:hypothetical protein
MFAQLNTLYNNEKKFVTRKSGASKELVRRIIEKVTVFDDKLIIGFKSGVVIDVEI